MAMSNLKEHATREVRVCIVYRVVQQWRAPIFRRLSEIEGWDLKVFFGCDFPGTKVVSGDGPFGFDAKKLTSIPVRLRAGTDGNVAMPLSVGLPLALARFKPDVIICEGASNLLNNILIYCYAVISRVPVVQWGLGEIRGRKKSRARLATEWLVRAMERRAAAVISYSSFGAAYYERIGVERSRIVTAVNVVDTDARKLELEKLSGCRIERPPGFHILFVGALEKPKRVDVLLETFARLEQEVVNCYLTIVGKGGESEALESYARELGLRNVRFTGQVTAGVSEIFLSADVFVMPGLGGLAVSDALVHGLPVICGVGDGSEADLVESGRNGYWDADLGVEKLYAYLRELADKPQLLQEMKVNASRTIEKFNTGSYVEGIRRAVEIAVARGGH